MINYQAQTAARRLIQKIEGQIDPFDIATGNDSTIEFEIEEMIRGLGGHKDSREMTPAGTVMYLLALIVANS